MDDATLHDRRWWALAILCCSLGIISLDNNVLNLAIPTLVRDLHASTSELQYIIDGYTLVFAGLLLTNGSLGDRFGRRRFLGYGLGVFLVGSTLSAFATQPWQLIVTRALMGVGGSLIMPATLSLLTNIFTDPRERGRAIGWWAAVAGAGSAVGPLIGGLLLRYFWWGSVFLINVPFIVVALIAGQWVLPESRDEHPGKLDPIGAVLSIVALVAVLWAIIESPVNGWSDPTVLGVLAVGVIGFIAFVRWELHVEEPMLDVRLFENRRFTAASSTLGLVFFAMFGSSFIFSQYLQTVLGYTPLQSGIRLLPMPVAMLVMSTQAPKLVEWLGSKIVVAVGLTLVVVGMSIAAFVPAHHGLVHLLIGMCIMSTGMGMTMAPATESVMGALPPSKAGVGSAVNDATRYVGGSLGVAVIGSILSASYRPAVVRAMGPFHLSAPALATARDSIGGAVDVASKLPGDLAGRAVDAAREQFVHAMVPSLLFAASIAVAALVVVIAFLPARAGDARESMESALDGIASLTFAEAEGALEMDAEEAKR